MFCTNHVQNMSITHYRDYHNQVIFKESNYSVGGAGGSRTRVQTRRPYAFYMLIPVEIFEKRQESDDQPLPYLLKLHQ